MEDPINLTFSFAICTYNRAFIIHKCLQSILLQKDVKVDFEILIIDNNSTDNTAQVVRPFVEQNTNFRYIVEKKQGLSYARNRAITEAKGKWIVYVDDDGILAPNYINRLEFILSNYDYDGFGGKAEPCFFYGRPKWLSKSFGLHSLPTTTDPGYINGKDGWLIGCNMVFRKRDLITNGGFNPELGMTKNQVVYGDDDNVQQKLIDAGLKLGFDSQLIVQHIIPPQKLKLSWHFKSAHAHGINWRKQRDQKYPLFRDYGTLCLSLIGLFIKRLPLSIFRFFFKKDYYWQNILLDTTQPIFNHAGRIRASLGMANNRA